MLKAIGYFVPEFPGQTHAFFWNEAMALRDAGVRVVFLSSRRPERGSCPHAFAAEAERQTHYVFPPATSAILGLLGRPRRLARCLGYVLGLQEGGLAEKAKVLALIPSAADLVRSCEREGIRHVHFHSCARSAHVGALAHRLGDIRFSVTVHGDLPVYGTNHAEKFAEASVVTTVTRPLAEQVRAVRPGATVPVIWMGIDVDHFAPAPGRPSGRRPGSVTFVTVARLNPAKGHAVFLEALRRLCDEGHDARYLIVGEGPARGEIEARVAALGLGPRVEVRGAVGQDVLPRLLNGADVFVLPSVGLGEAAPVSVMEAMACGLPVICSRIGGTTDMIEDGVDGVLVAKGDVEGLAAAARRLLADPALRRRTGEAARRKALTMFDYRVKARELLSVLERPGAAPDMAPDMAKDTFR